MIRTYWSHAPHLYKILFYVVFGLYTALFIYTGVTSTEEMGVEWLLDQFGGSWFTYILHYVIPILPYAIIIVLSGWFRYIVQKDSTENLDA